MKGIKSLTIFVFVILVATYVFAQNEDVIIERDIVGVHGEEGGMAIFEEPAPPPGSFIFISSLFEMEDKVVKGAPYSAEAQTERVQTLSDGNRIVHKNNSQVFRDSVGRIRREQEFGMIGNWVSAEQPERHIFINDPIAGVHYVLEPQNQIARKMRMPAGKRDAGAKPPQGSTEEDEVFIAPPRAGAFRHKMQMRMRPENTRKESLGKQMIEGVEAEGTRTVSTIPAGDMGNERPIEMVSEKWYSSELKLYVMTKHSDPRFGETTYRLTNIKRGEPDAALFQVPSGYKIEEGPGPRIKIKHKAVD